MLGISIERQGEVAILSVGGDLEMASVPTFRQGVIDLVADGERTILVDLTGTDFIDSTGLGSLVAALKRVRSSDGTLDIVCSQPRLRELFKLTDLDRIFPLYGSIDEAVAAIGAGA